MAASVTTWRFIVIGHGDKFMDWPDGQLAFYIGLNSSGSRWLKA